MTRSSILSDRDVEGLVLTHYDFVWRFLMRLGVHEADAEDMAQQVFLVLNAHREAPEPGSERAYLAGVARRVASTYRRSQRRRRDSLIEPPDTADTSPGPEEAVARRQGMVALDGILTGSLDETEREVFVLYEIEQLTTTEIATALSIPLGTVASRLRRARAKFVEAAREVSSPRATHESPGGTRAADDSALLCGPEESAGALSLRYIQRGGER